MDSNEMGRRLDLLADEMETILIAVRECHEEVRKTAQDVQQMRQDIRELRDSCGCRHGLPPRIPTVPYPPSAPLPGMTSYTMPATDKAPVL